MNLLDEMPMDPITGELVDPTNADQLIDSLERCKNRQKELAAAREQLESALALLAACKDRTERVAGERRKVKIEWPGKTFDSTSLKTLWHTAPKFRDEFLRITGVGVKLTEYDKLLRTSGPPELEAFKSSLILCEKDGLGKPTISIEV